MEGSAGREPGQSGGVVQDRVQDHAGAPRRIPSPGLRGFQHEPLGRELDGPVGSAPDPRGARPRDRERETGMSQERQERRVRLSHDDLDRRALTAPHLPDDPLRATKGTDPGGGAGRRLVGGDALGEGGDDLVGAERGAVVKLDVLAEPEGPDQPVAGDGPRRRERRLDVAALPEGDQPLVEKAHRQELGRSRRVRRVETRGNAPHADVELSGRRRERRGGDGAQRGERHERGTRRGEARSPELGRPSNRLGAHRRPL